jgi:Acetoacetate decarboxylase (ADC)
LFVHRLPTSQPVAVALGRTVWGFPRDRAAIDISSLDGRAACAVLERGEHVLTLEIRAGGPLRLQDPNLPNYAGR